MAVFLVLRHRSGPEWQPGLPLEEQSGWDQHAAIMDAWVESGFIVLGGPLEDEFRVVLAVEAESEEAVHATLALDNWTGSHLETRSVDLWTIRLDGRART